MDSKVTYLEVQAFSLGLHDLSMYQTNDALELIGVIKLLPPLQICEQSIDDRFLCETLLCKLCDRLLFLA